MIYHQPVLLKESVEGLAIKPGGIYVDATYGGGGHSREILGGLGEGRLFVFDQDEEAFANLPEDRRLVAINHNFRYLRNFLKYYQAIPADGILADLGVSWHQFDTPERGFSTRWDGLADMRMNRDTKLTAKEILNTYTEDRLREVFRNYGEIRNAGPLAASIVRKRQSMAVDTLAQLREIVIGFAHKGLENKYMAQVFQALRIEVNDELGALRDLLLQSSEVLRRGGRIAVISYHSLEDRIVKNYFRAGNFEGKEEKDFYGNVHAPLRQITRKPVVPGEDEIRGNSRARSAKLRIAEKI